MANTVLRFDPSTCELDLQIRIARDGEGLIEFYDEAGDPVDMTGTEWELLLKGQSGSSKNVIKLTSVAGDIIITGDNNETLEISITEAVSAIAPACYFYEIYRPDLKKTWFTGRAEVTNGIYCEH